MASVLAMFLIIVLGCLVEGQSEDFRCPSDTGTYPDAADSKRFFQCVSGKAVLHTCITGLVFSVEASGCVEVNTSKGNTGDTQTNISRALLEIPHQSGNTSTEERNTTTSPVGLATNQTLTSSGVETTINQTLTTSDVETTINQTLATKPSNSSNTNETTADDTSVPTDLNVTDVVNEIPHRPNSTVRETTSSSTSQRSSSGTAESSLNEPASKEVTSPELTEVLANFSDGQSKPRSGATDLPLNVTDNLGKSKTEASLNDTKSLLETGFGSTESPENSTESQSESTSGPTESPENSTESQSESRSGPRESPENSTESQSESRSGPTGAPENSTSQPEEGSEVTPPKSVAYQASLEELLAAGRARQVLAESDYDDVDSMEVEEKFLCPNESGFFRHPTNCSRFYWCNHFIPTAMFCAPETAFDPKTHVCSWPVGRDGCGGQLPLPKHTHGPAAQQVVSPKTTPSVESTDKAIPSQQVHGGRHPRQVYRGSYNNRGKTRAVINDDDDTGRPAKSVGLNSRDVDSNVGKDNYQCPGDGFYADPDDCTYFYHCSVGKAYKFQCQNGTAFNRDKFVCSWPVGDDGCGGMLSVPFRQVLEEELGLSSDQVGTSFRCPEPEGFFPDPENCTVFFHCVKNRPYRHECGSGTVFSVEKGLCVWSEPDADCSTSRPVGVSYRAGLGADRPDDVQNNKGPASSQNKGSQDKVQEDDMLHHDDHHSHSDVNDDSANDHLDPSSRKTEANEDKVLNSKQAATSEATPKAASPEAEKTGHGTRSTSADKAPKAETARDFSQVASAWPWANVDKKSPPDTQQLSAGIQLILSTGTAPTQASTASGTTATSTPSHAPSEKSSTGFSATLLPAEQTSLRAELYRVIGLETDFRCPKPAGHFRDPRNCAVYYHCADGVAYRMDCPDGQLYDIRQHQCLDIPQVKDCVRVDKDEVDDWEERWLGTYPEADSYPKTKDLPESFECEESTGFHRNPNDCSSYIECIDGTPYARKCMTGTVFDDSRKKCTWPSLVPECNSGNRTPGEIHTEDFECPSLDGYYRNPRDCSTFFHCIDGKAMIRKCDANLFFDPQTSKCRWSLTVRDCDRNGRPVILEKLPLSSFTCPLPNGHFRDPIDCSTFFHCLHDFPYRGQCREGNAFDLDTLTCKPRSKVPSCAGDLSPTEQSAVPETSQTTMEEGQVTDVVDQQWRRSDDAVSVSDDNNVSPSKASGFRCPKAHGLYRDPADCGFFFHCFAGRSFRHQCEQGTVFSSEKNLCTWPSLVPECQEVKQEADVTSQLAPLTTPVPQQTARWESRQETEPPAGPVNTPRTAAEEWFKTGAEEAFKTVAEEELRAGVQEAFKTVAEDQLKKAGEVLHAVEDETQARRELQVEPVDVHDFDYDLAETHVGDISSDGINDFVLESPIPGSQKIQPVPDDSYTKFVCPPVVMDQYYRDPVDCTRFHRCVKGTRFTFICPRGTFFEPILSVCDFQEKVPDCGSDGIRLSAEKLLNGVYMPVMFPGIFPVPRGQSKAELPSPGEHSPESGALCPRLDGMFPHPSSCRKFVYCSRGAPVVLTCPTDLLYNSKTMTCDYEENTVCSRYDK